MQICTIHGYRMDRQQDFEMVIEGDDDDFNKIIVNLLDEFEILIIGIEVKDVESD